MHELLIEGGTRGRPGPLRRSAGQPVGIHAVLVNGQLAVYGGEMVEPHAGRVLRRGA